MKTSIKTIMLAAALSVTAIPTMAQDFGGGMPPAIVAVQTLEERTIAPTMDVTGTVISLNDSAQAAEVEGVLAWIADVGTVASKGDVIARLDDRLAKIAVRRAEAALKRLKADLPRREADVVRYKGLAANDNASKATLESVLAARDILLQDVADAQAMLDQMKGDFERTKVRARFDGHVVARLANIGEYINIGQAVVQLVDTKNIEIALPAPITSAPFIAVGQNLDITYAGGTMSLPVRTVVPVGDQVSRQVEVRLEATGSNMVVGMPVTVKLPKMAPVTSIAVPRDAIVRRETNFYVYRVGADNAAEQVLIEIGTLDGAWIAPKGDTLKAGDRVIIRGAERLQPGQSVMVQ